MMSSGNYNTKGALTLSNSIIGVSILAMPFCMKSCGIVLGIVLLIGSSLLTRFTCHLLLKSAIISRRKTFEFIAFQTFGSSGKLLAELNIIGFMLGLIISFFVVFGDLGTAIISELLNLENSNTLRTITLIILGFGVALPLAMLKEIDVLSKISTLSVIFYIVLALKIVFEALPVLLTEYWKTKVTLWDPSGILKCLPIFALSLSCQTQIFTIYDSLPDPSLKTMNSIVKIAVYLCTALYMIVGLFGYIGGCDKEISGNILINLSPGFFTEIIKLCFVMSVALSFPLVVIPLRTSIHSLLFKKATGPFDVGIGMMSEIKFKVITLIIVFFTFIIGYLCPNIEIVLGFVGSTIGVLICIIFPALIFVRLTSKNTFEKRGAQIVLLIGVLLLLSCTWMHIQTVRPYSPVLEEIIDTNEVNQYDLIQENGPAKELIGLAAISIPFSENLQLPKEIKNDKLESVNQPVPQDDVKRQEPPVPESPDEKIEVIKENENNAKVLKTTSKETEVLQKLENEEKKAVLEQVEIIKKLEAHQEVEKKLLEERRQLLADIISHKKVHDDKNPEIDDGKKSEIGNNEDKQTLPVVSKTEKHEILSKMISTVIAKHESLSVASEKSQKKIETLNPDDHNSILKSDQLSKRDLSDLEKQPEKTDSKETKLDPKITDKNDNVTAIKKDSSVEKLIENHQTQSITGTSKADVKEKLPEETISLGLISKPSLGNIGRDLKNEQRVDNSLL